MVKETMRKCYYSYMYTVSPCYHVVAMCYNFILDIGSYRLVQFLGKVATAVTMAIALCIRGLEHFKNRMYKQT